MRRRRQRFKINRSKRGKGIPYVYKNRVYWGKKPKTGSGLLSGVLAQFLPLIGSITGL